MDGLVQNIGLLFFRVSIGCLMMFGHGWGKLVNFSKIAPGFPDPLGLGSTASLGLTVFAEFFCAFAIILGLKTRWASIPLVITFLVIPFIVHGGDPWRKQEFAILYLIPFITLMCIGGGKYGLDSVISRKG
ncbi:MAG: DoxX family protein [Halobacteriovoraceae bacterium]|jgi:putative oxidoreductase|nr:DoxX family protein [Halobacteriovoraceae bacterium]MBT5094937.1 DoxX family protein [Halobacteriovoraceae bacterium]